MRKNNFLIVLIATLFCGTLLANEFRSPLAARGPMRYLFEQWDKDDYGLKLWSSLYARESHKAFMSHGFNTQPLSALFFNKADFWLNEIFPNSYADPATQYYSPYIATTKISPRVNYTEKGITLGGCLSFPVKNNRGRIGLRASVPFKRCELERKDDGDNQTDQLSEVMTADVIRVGNDNNVSYYENVLGRAIRLDFLESLNYTWQQESIINYANVADSNVKIAGSDSHKALDSDSIIGSIIAVPFGIIPRWPTYIPGIHKDRTQTALDSNAGNAVVGAGNYYNFMENPTTANHYSPLSVRLNTTPATKLAAQEKAADLWWVSAHAKGSGLGGGDDGEGETQTARSNNLWHIIDNILMQYNSNTFGWLEDRGFEFQSTTKAGMGDLDLDLFYEHMINDSLMGEVMVGMRFPTGGGNSYCGNPYIPQLGNGNHFEIKVGGMLALEWSWYMNTCLNAKYSFVLEGKEKRSATFEGASIKNIGPCTDADVSWQYFVGQLDFNFFHPKTDAISGLLGYEFYYKTEDNVTFSQRTMSSWLGQVYSGGAWGANPQTLSSGVMERNTESFGHKLRTESSFRISKWFEMYFGATYMFAGQNIPRESDGHIGFIVTF